MKVAALFVAKRGHYYGVENIDPWDEARDARRYAGPYPVIAHPPCERWGRYAEGAPWSKGKRMVVGADDGCFAAALAAVRKWGGVLEHPADSKAWGAFKLMLPPACGGWVVADDVGGWTCRVEQGHYGHRARKPTWLYAVDCELPSLRWGRSVDSLGPAKRARTRGAIERMGRPERLRTPLIFRDELITMARSVYARRAA